MTVPSIRALEPLVGMSHTMLNRHFRSGKFAMEPGGGFDPDKVAAALNRNRSVVQPSQAKGARGHRPAVSTRAPESNDPHDEYNIARAHREKMTAKDAELNLKERIGELIEVAKVEAKWAEVGARVKDGVMALPTRVVNRLPDEWRKQAHQIISEESRRLLTEIAHEFLPDRATT